jgi:glycosyltransferase involved in cell wall biosynthesis
MGLADRVIAVSNGVAQSMVEAGIPQRKLSVVLNGTLGSARAGHAGQHSKADLRQPAIVTVAGLNYRKGIGELLTAFEMLAPANPSAHLYIVGTGPERELFEERGARSSFAGRIHFEGFRPNPFPYMLSAHIFVLASLRDSCPLVLTEARECGCAIVASDVDGIPEALSQGRGGLLVPPGDVQALSDALAFLLATPSEVQRLRVAAKDGIEKFTVRRMAADVIDVYNDLTGRREPIPNEETNV